MKIKRERQVRLDEIIKHIFDKEIKDEVFRNKDLLVTVYADGSVFINNYIEKSDLFTITEEIEIYYDTRLDLIAVRKVGTVSRFENRSIQGVLVHFEGEVDYIYFQNPDGSIGDLIWSKECGLVD